MRSPRFFPILCATALLAATARADDDPKPGSDEAKKKASALLKEAYSHWTDKDPAKCRELAEKARDLDPEDPIALDFLGTLYDAKFADADKALASYDAAIGILAGKEGAPEKRRKAEIATKKAVVLYAYKDDLEGARAAYESSLATLPLATTADSLSNLLHRLAGQTQDEAKRKAQHESALKYAEKAQELVPFMKEDKGDPNHRHLLAKVKAQLALCQEALGEKEKAGKTLASVEEAEWDGKCAYNLALLEALHGEAKKAEDHLREFMKLRPTPRSRNQLRKMIRTEPDFAKLKGAESWKDLVGDEPESEKPEK